MKFVIAAATVIIMLTPDFAGAVSYKKHDRILKKAVASYRALKHSPVKWRVIGRSSWKKSIYYREFGTGEKLTLIIGGIHGDEPAGVIAAVKLAQHIRKNPSSIKNRVVIIPCLNPDGLIKGRRTNGHKVDINRNFPSATWSPEYIKDYNNPGRLPASEPETIIIANAIEEFRPAMIIQLHQPFNMIYPDSGTPAALVRKMSEITGIPVGEDVGYPTPGSLGSYKSLLDYGVYGVTFELCEIDREPDYKNITKSLIEAINY